MKQLPNLEVLVLANNGIQAEGAKHLAQGLSTLHSLKVLHLPGNFLGDSGVAALSAALGPLTQLTSLQLQENYNIGTEGARALGAFIGTSSSLQVSADVLMEETIDSRFSHRIALDV